MVFVTSCHWFRRYTGDVDPVKRRGRGALRVTPQDTSWSVAGQLTVSEYGPSVHNDMGHSDCQLIGLERRPAFTKGQVVEDRDICEGTVLYDASILKANPVGRCAAKSVYGLGRAEEARALH